MIPRGHSGPAPDRGSRSRPRATLLRAGLPIILPVGLLLPLLPALLQAAPGRGRESFDRRTLLKLPHQSSVFTRGDFNGDGLPDILAAGPGHLTIFRQGYGPAGWRLKDAPGPDAAPVAAAAGRIDGDGRDDAVIVSGSRPCVATVHLTDPSGRPVPSLSLELPGEASTVVIADADGDRKADILVCGRKMLGIPVFRGDGRGGFTPGPVLFPEVSFSRVVVAHIDGDDRPDIAAIDWIGNRVLVFPGFGGLHFSDPVTLAYDEEPVALAVGDLDADGRRDIVVGLSGAPAFSVHHGDGTGGFPRSTRHPLPAAPERIRIGDADGDARNDLLLFLPSPGTIVVRYQDGEGGFDLWQTFAAGPSAADVLFFQDRRRRFLNAAVLAPDDGVVRLLHNRWSGGGGRPDAEYATGGDPSAMLLADLNEDGWTDVLLAQGSEETLNVFLNDGRGGFRGQVSHPVPHPVHRFVAPGRKGIGGRDLIAAGPDGRSLTYLTLTAEGTPTEIYSAFLDRPAYPVDGRRLEEGEGRRVLVLRRSAGNAGPSLAILDLAGRSRYEEIEIHLDLPRRVSSWAVHDLDGDGRNDLFLLTPPDTGREWSGTPVFQEGEGFRVGEQTPLAFAAAGTRNIAAWLADPDGDGIPDLILNAGEPDGVMVVAPGEPGGGFGGVRTVGREIRVPGAGALAVADFDGDGRPDLLFANDRTKTVQFLPGEPDGGWSDPVNLTGARGVACLGIADLDRDGERELLLGIAGEGILSVTSFHHPLFEREASDEGD